MRTDKLSLRALAVIWGISIATFGLTWWVSMEIAKAIFGAATGA